MLSIQRDDWPKLHVMFKAHVAKTWHPVGFPVRICAFNLLFIIIFNDVGARIESRCVTEAELFWLSVVLNICFVNQDLLFMMTMYIPANSPIITGLKTHSEIRLMREETSTSKIMNTYV